MADGPTVIETGGGSGATVIAVIAAILAIVALLFVLGVVDFGGTSRSVDVDVKMPAIETPQAPAAPAQ
jgi:hypothetical protein